MVSDIVKCREPFKRVNVTANTCNTFCTHKSIFTLSIPLKTVLLHEFFPMKTFSFDRTAFGDFLGFICSSVLVFLDINARSRWTFRAYNAKVM